MTDKLVFEGVDAALAHFDKNGKAATEAVRVYRHQVKELTGHSPEQALTALDVVKIVQKVFFGGANAGARTAGHVGSLPDPGGAESPANTSGTATVFPPGA